MSDSNGPPEPPFPLDVEHMRKLMQQARATAEEVLREELARNPGASLEDLNAALQKHSETMNRRPQQEMGGLSPTQVRQLLSDGWEGRAGAVRLNSALTLKDLETSRTLYNARVFLRYLEEQGQAKATSAGNLSRAAVAALLERMQWPAGFVEEVHKYSKVLNEMEVFPIHVLRLVLDLGGLIKRRTGKFSLTRRGATMLADEQAGELFALLFRTTFRKLNLGYLDGLPPVPDFQNTVAYPLYRLGQVMGNWKLPEEVVDRVVLPFLRSQLPPEEYMDPLALMLVTRLLRPLESFGLVEQNEVPDKRRLLPSHAYRKTPLYDRFLRFHLPPMLPQPRGPIREI
jgi:hypothetical protein